MMEHEKIFVLVREDSNGNSENVAMSWLRQDLLNLFTKMAEIEPVNEYLYSIQCFDISYSVNERLLKTPELTWNHAVIRDIVSVEILTLAEHGDEQDG